MDTKWIIVPHDKNLAARLSKELGVQPIIARILANRGISDVGAGQIFLNPRLSHLPDPFLIPDMEIAAKRICAAIKTNEKIAIFGDYDTDGITSTALLVRFFRDCGLTAGSYIPNRLTEGYGLSKKGIEILAKSGVSLVITVDNGSNSFEELRFAGKKGLDVIVTDHHEISSGLPEAIAVVNPKRIKATSEFKNLAGVGVAFYLACAIRGILRNDGFFGSNEPELKKYLDLVAIGTIADVAPLTGLNRILVKHGVEVLKNTNNAGIKALAEAASTPLNEINSRGIAYRLAPRINAAGRLGDQELALRLLLTDEENEASQISGALNKMNTERQAVEKKILCELEEIIKKTDKAGSSLVFWSENWHPGVIGIAASKMADIHKKPCALISLAGESGRGSVRSVGTFNIMETLKSCEPHLMNYGGHTAAGGFDIDAKNLGIFAKQFERHASENLREEDRCDNLEIDSEIGLQDINVKLIEELEQLAPFGEGNPQPVLTTTCFAKGAKIVGTGHLKLKLSDNFTTMEAIGFGLGETKLEPNQKYNFAGIPELNHWNGRTSIQFKMKDIKSA